MALLFILFAVAMGMGTFIEHWYNTDTAIKLVYNAWWFEGILFLFCVNFIGNIKRYNLLKRKKWPILLIHLSLIMLLVGAFVTRYIGFEGTMPIREGQLSNQIISKENYLKIVADGVQRQHLNRLTIQKPLLLAAWGSNHFKVNETLNDTPFEITYVDYIMNAYQDVVSDPSGSYYIKVTMAQNDKSEEFYLKDGEVKLINNKLISFNNPTANAIDITKTGDSYFISTPESGTYTRMSDELTESFNKNETKRLRFRWLYDFGDARFVFQKFNDKGRLKLIPEDYTNDESKPDALLLNVKAGDEEKQVTLWGNKGIVGSPKQVQVGGLNFSLSFGSKAIKLPFSIQLNDFIAEKYPGTQNSYASFESRVTVLNEPDIFDARIYMNNVLDYKGYRFFQASFHPDEKGTILSVNHDFWGTWITYIGYGLLYLALIYILFDKNSRFGSVRRKLRKLQNSTAATSFLFLLLMSTPVLAQQPNGTKIGKTEAATFITKKAIGKEHAAKFGALVIQDGNGRMKPINTFSSELLRKVHKSNTYKNLNADQAFLSTLLFPEIWYQAPVIKLKKENIRLKRIIGLNENAEYAALSDLFRESGWYKISSYLSDAYSAFIPTQFQKDIIELDRKANLLNFALRGSVLRIFPVPDDSSNKWVSYSELNHENIQGADSLFVSNILPLYLSALTNAIADDNYAQANILLDKIQAYQKKFGSRVKPSELKVSAEILYNKFNVFEKLRNWYLLSGLILILFGIATIMSNKKWVNNTASLLHYVIGFFFVLHTAGIVIRWYISGHAPWSDAYESMIYVSWATLLFGLILGRKSTLTLGASAFMTSIILMVAHWNWMDPAIANLQPVLNSYWLMIHVAIIVASYGPFTLGMVLGVIALVLMAFTTSGNRNRLNTSITEIVYITELTLTVGLVMLTIGNFLGGQWANESWGRYWGWDPKETWALISIIIYAFVIHMRIVPSLYNKWIFAVMSVLAYYSILMTYFGVNFYLSGLHSYASGDKVVTPVFIYYSLAGLAALAGISFYKNKKFLQKRRR